MFETTDETFPGLSAVTHTHILKHHRVPYAYIQCHVLIYIFQSELVCMKTLKWKINFCELIKNYVYVGDWMLRSLDAKDLIDHWVPL